MILDIQNHIIAIRGAGDIGSGIGYRLFRCGFKVIFLEIRNPSNVRRKVSFSEAVYDGETKVEGIKARCVSNVKEAFKTLDEGIIPVIIDPIGETIIDIKPYVLIDSIINKKNMGTYVNMADLVIGVGPGFIAGEDVDIVIESNRGQNLSKIITNGQAEPNTGIPANVKGYTIERVLRANKDGQIEVLKDIGYLVKKGEILAYIDGEIVKAEIDGVIRGMIKNGYYVKKGMKIGDIDPRGNRSYCYKISDKAMAIGGGVLEGILYHFNQKVENDIV